MGAEGVTGSRIVRMSFGSKFASIFARKYETYVSTAPGRRHDRCQTRSSNWSREHAFGLRTKVSSNAYSRRELDQEAPRLTSRRSRSIVRSA